MPKLLYNLSFDDWEKFKVQRESGATEHWKVHTFEITEDSPERMHHLMVGRDPGEPGVYTGLYFRKDSPDYIDHPGMGWEPSYVQPDALWRPMMSDTKAEVTDHFEFLDKCMFPGNEELSVLITGLGLGMVAEACLKVGVGHVTVVDRDPEVIELIAGQIDHPRLHVVQADAMTWEPDRKFDLAWNDIWPTISPSNLADFKAMRRHYRPHVRYWQGFWAFENVKWMDRMENHNDVTGLLRVLRDPVAHSDTYLKAVELFVRAQQQPLEVWKYLSDGREGDRLTFARHIFHTLTGKAAPDRVLP